MASIDPIEIQSWTKEQVIQAIRDILPQGQILKYQFHTEGYFEVVVVDTNTDNRIVSENRQIDLRLALLNVFGELWLSSVPLNPRWSPQPGIHRSFPKQSRTMPEDPEDLNPDIVTAVYRKTH